MRKVAVSLLILLVALSSVAMTAAQDRVPPGTWWLVFYPQLDFSLATASTGGSCRLRPTATSAR